MSAYTYIKNGYYSIYSIEDYRTVKSSLEIKNKYIHSNQINIINYSCGSDLTLKINSLKTNFNIEHQIIMQSIEIINIGKGFKNNDRIRVQLDANLFMIIILLENSQLYNTYNAHSQIYKKHINNDNINLIINNIPDSIYPINSGDITNDFTNNLSTTSIKTNDIIYNKPLDSIEDIKKYITTTLLALLGYYKKRNLVNQPETNLLDTNLITPSMVKYYNSEFIGLYFTTSLHYIKSINNIHSYNLENINLIKSNISKINNINIDILPSTNILSNYHPLISTYDNISFNNSLQISLNLQNQFSNIITKAYSVENSILSPITVFDNVSLSPIVDVSTITDNSKSIKIVIENTSEDLQNISTYTITGSRTNSKSTDSSIYKILSYMLDNNKTLISTLSNISDNSKNYIILFKKPLEFEIILTNIYSTQSLEYRSKYISINKLSETAYKTNYNIISNEITNFIPDKFNISLNVTNENNDSPTSYNIIFKKIKSTIADIDNIIITNVTNILPFSKNYYHYNGLQIDNTTNITLYINKTDIYSTISTNIKYYDSTTQTYITEYNNLSNIIHNISPTSNISHIKIEITCTSEDLSNKKTYYYYLSTAISKVFYYIK